MSPYIGFLIGIVFAFVCAYIAKKKSRNQLIWFVAGLFFPIFALIILLILPSLENRTAEEKKEIAANLSELQELENTESLESSKKELQNDLPSKLWYYLDAQNQQCGPMTIEALMNELKDGKIKSDTFVWNEDLSDWKPLQETSDFQLFQTKKNKPTS